VAQYEPVEKLLVLFGGTSDTTSAIDNEDEVFDDMWIYRIVRR